MADCLVVAEGAPEIPVQNAFPVAAVLLDKRGVETVSVAGGGDVGGRRAFAEYLLDGVSGDEVDEQENKGDDEPDYWQSVEDALEESSQLPALSC